MPVDKHNRDFPACTVALVALAVTSHSLVLVGNLSTSRLLSHLGDSSFGWASIGTSLANALHNELDPAMEHVTYLLTESITAVSHIEGGVDVMLSLSGTATDAALLTFNSTAYEAGEFKATVVDSVSRVADDAMAKVRSQVNKLLDLMRPALEQIREWLTSFSQHIRDSLHDFSTTVDRAQKIFDQVMSTQSGGAARHSEKVMLRETYFLFDVDNSGEILTEDLVDVARLYGITALAGKKAAELIAKYDANHAGGLDKAEFVRFVHDPSIQGILTVMLRTYAKKLAILAGHLATARTNDEVTDAVADFLTLYSAKNLTKVSWVVQALSNGTYPLDFTAGVLEQLALDAENPSRLALLDVGDAVMSEMLTYNPDNALKAIKRLTEESFWAASGFDLQLQPAVVERVF